MYWHFVLYPLPKQWIHLRCSDRCPPTSTILKEVSIMCQAPSPLHPSPFSYFSTTFLYLNSISQMPVVGILVRRMSCKGKVREFDRERGQSPDLMGRHVARLGNPVQVLQETESDPIRLISSDYRIFSNHAGKKQKWCFKNKKKICKKNILRTNPGPY